MMSLHPLLFFRELLNIHVSVNDTLTFESFKPVTLPPCLVPLLAQAIIISPLGHQDKRLQFPSFHSCLLSAEDIYMAELKPSPSWWQLSKHHPLPLPLELPGFHPQTSASATFCIAHSGPTSWPLAVLPTSSAPFYLRAFAHAVLSLCLECLSPTLSSLWLNLAFFVTPFKLKFKWCPFLSAFLPPASMAPSPSDNYWINVFIPMRM